jgi:hypothetical protein
MENDWPWVFDDDLSPAKGKCQTYNTQWITQFRLDVNLYIRDILCVLMYMVRCNTIAGGLCSVFLFVYMWYYTSSVLLAVSVPYNCLSLDVLLINHVLCSLGCGLAICLFILQLTLHVHSLVSSRHRLVTSRHSMARRNSSTSY